MRRLYSITRVLIVVVLAVCPLARAQDPNSEDQVKELAREVLNGRQAVVRLYIGWKTDPKAYKTMTVPLDGLDVSFDVIRQIAGGSLPGDAAVVVVVPGDQRDKAVLEVMGDCLFGQPYSPDGRITLWPGHIPPIQWSTCLFEDALREPIPSADVEILLADNHYEYSAQVRLWIASATLDKNGRMSSLKASASCKLCSFLFVVNHPDCGPVPAISRSYPSDPSQDHVLSVGALPKERWCVFTDALGKPMAGATVEIHAGMQWQPDTSGGFATIQLDEAGRLCPPCRQPSLEQCCFLVSHRDYGQAIVEPYSDLSVALSEPVLNCIVPLTEVGTRADERSLWGVVVDSNDKPVAGAVVQCGSVTIPGGNRLKAFFGQFALSNKCAKVPTDDEGRFGMHLPLTNADGSLGRLVPPGAKYQVMIEAPPELDLEPFYGSLSAGQEHTITMQPVGVGPKDFTGILVFTDGQKPVTDLAMLAEVKLSVRSTTTGGTRTYGYSDGSWMDQATLPFGTYAATAQWDGVLYTFGPVEVNADSPQTVVLTPTGAKVAERVYCGRVVNGITGRPIADAVVMPRFFPDGAVADIVGEEGVDQLVHFGPELVLSDELLRILEQQAGWPMARTGISGQYQIVLPTAKLPELSFGLVALAADFLGAEQQLCLLPGQIDPSEPERTERFEPDGTGKVTLPDMKLFPAGTVVVDPCVPDQNEPHPQRDVIFRYLTAHGDPTPWLKELWAPPIFNQGQCVFYKQRLPVNQLQSVYVPANVTLTLVIQKILQPQAAPIVVENVRLAQGQTLDLGHVEFARAIQVVVRVLNSKDEPLEGIAVRCLAERIGDMSRTGVSDVEGRAHVHVPPNSQGQLVVDYRDKETRTRPQEGIAYQVGGEDDIGREFVLRLSDEFLDRLLESQQ